MKILVPVKCVDEVALEAAVRLRERGEAAAGAEIVAVGIGAPAGEETLRSALARGADRALLVVDDQPADPGVVSHLLAALFRRERPDLVLIGKGQTGPRLAGLLGLPQATFASGIELSPDGSHARVTRVVDAGRETLELTLPAVITADPRLADPRILALPAILKARTKPLERIAVSDLGPRPAPTITILRREAPPARKPGRKVRDVDELIAALRDEARVLAPSLPLTPRPPLPQRGEGETVTGTASASRKAAGLSASPSPLRGRGGRGVRGMVLAETDGGRVLPGTLPAITFAQTLARATGGDFDLLLVGGPEIASEAEAWRGYGAGRVFVAAAPGLAHPTADGVAAVCAAAIRQAGAASLAGPASTFGRDVLPRVAALLDLPMVSNVFALEMADGCPAFRRYAGSVIATVQIGGEAGVFSVPGVAWDKPEMVPTGSAVETLAVDAAALPPGTTWLGRDPADQARPELTAARVVVAGGRPLRDAATFERLIGGLADKFGGAVGASGGAVAADLASNALLIGQTGKIVRPDLYVAVGISGSDQHVAGMKDSRIIVAINEDPDAPIFGIADYGLVANLHKAIPEMLDKL